MHIIEIGVKCNNESLNRLIWTTITRTLSILFRWILDQLNVGATVSKTGKCGSQKPNFLLEKNNHLNSFSIELR